MRRPLRGDRGAIIPFVALTLGVLVLSSALAVDIGHQMLMRRDLQKLSDAMALDMVRSLDGSPPSAFNAGGAKNAAWQDSFTATRARNSFPATTRQIATAEAGCMTAANTFSSADADCMVTNADGNLVSVAQAARVIATNTVNYFFYPGSGTSTRTGIASRDGTVDYSVGSFLAGTSTNANQVKLLNWVLGKALGSSSPLSLDAAGYDGLAAGSVTARGIAAAYGLASPDQLFSGSLNARRFFNATADAVQSNGGTAAQVNALRSLAATVDGGAQFNYSGVMSPGGSTSGGSGNGSAADTSMDLPDLIQASAFAINGSNTLSIPNLDITLPFGLGSVDLTLKVIETPRFAYGAHVGNQLHTSQVQMGIVAHISTDATAALQATINGLGIGVVSVATIDGTITVSPQVAGATATPDAIRCADVTPNPGTTISLSSNPITATASEQLALSAQFAPLPKVTVLNVNQTTTTVSTTASGGSADFAYTSDFSPPAGTAGPKRLGGGSLNLASALQVTTGNSTQVGATIPQPNSVAAVNNVLQTTVIPGIQTQLLPLITRTLGLQIGGGDVSAVQLGDSNGRCTSVKLAG